MRVLRSELLAVVLAAALAVGAGACAPAREALVGASDACSPQGGLLQAAVSNPGVVAVHTSPWGAQMQQARAAAEAGNLAQAEAGFLAARDTAAGCRNGLGYSALALTGLGAAYERFGLAERAIATYREAVALDGQAGERALAGHAIEPWLRLARLHVERGEKKPAHDAYERAFTRALEVTAPLGDPDATQQLVEPIADEYWTFLVGEGRLEEAGGVALRRDRARRAAEAAAERARTEAERARPLPPAVQPPRIRAVTPQPPYDGPSGP